MARQVLYRQRKASKYGYLLGGAYIRGALCIFENKPPPQSGPCLMLKKQGRGAYFREDTVWAIQVHFGPYLHDYTG